MRVCGHVYTWLCVCTCVCVFVCMCEGVVVCGVKEYEIKCRIQIDNALTKACEKGCSYICGSVCHHFRQAMDNICLGTCGLFIF